MLETVHKHGFLIERCADNFLIVEPDAVQLAEELGLAAELLTVSPQARRALILRGNHLHPVPSGLQIMAPARLWPLLFTPLLSWRGRLRLACEPLIPASTSQEDESLGAFVRRRLGREAFERIVQPLAGGIYTADPDRLSLQAVLPRFPAMEKKHGSLYAGMRAKAKEEKQLEETRGARYSQFLTLRNGMSQLTETLAQQLGPHIVSTGARVVSLAPNSMMESPATESARKFERPLHWQMTFSDGPPKWARSVVLALPASVSNRMVRSFDASLSDALSAIPYDGSAVVVLGYRNEAVKHPLDASGFVVPHCEGRKILAASFSSSKFPHRAPEGCCLIRVFLGGALQRNLLRNSDEELLKIAQNELADILGISQKPLVSDVVRWDNAMPQYHLGHLQRVADIMQGVAKWPGLFLAGAAFHGVGIPNCIRDGANAGASVIQFLEK